MKNLKLLIVILVAAQWSYAQEIDFGAKLGLNFATLNDASGFDNKTGFVGGAFFGAKFTKVGLQAELLYSQQGAEFDATEFDLNYVNIPVLFKFYLIGGLNIQAGPQFGFLVDDNLEDSVISDVEAETFDLSGAAGLGFDLPAGLKADARYIFGVTDTFDNFDGQNGVFMLSLGYSFL